MANLYVVNDVDTALHYVRRQRSFPFDVVDVERSLDEVLAYFGFGTTLLGDDRRRVRRELLRIALGAELTEMAQVIDRGLTSGLERLCRKLHPDFDDARSNGGWKPRRPIR
jgi:hypothetical protein